MRILCAVHVHLGLVTTFRRFPELRREPVIVGRAPELCLPVVAASAAARASGVRPGQALRHAQQLCPAAASVSLDAAAVERLREAICRALSSLTPAVEAADEELFCDVSGTHAAYGDEPSWAAAVARTLDRTLDTDPPSIGIGSTRFVARTAAQRGEPGRIRRVRSGDEAAFLAPLPLGVLPIDPAITARLAAFGLDSLGAVASLAPADLERQFGPEGRRLHRLVRCGSVDGDDRLHAAGEARTWSERIVLEGAVSDLAAIAEAARRCAADAGTHLSECGLAANAVTVTCELDECPEVTATDVTPRPVANPADTWAAVLLLLGKLRFEAPVTAVRVKVAGLAPASARQPDMLRPGDAACDDVSLAAARLRARFGDRAVRLAKLALDPGDVPERRYLWADATAAAGR